VNFFESVRKGPIANGLLRVCSVAHSQISGGRYPAIERNRHNSFIALCSSTHCRRCRYRRRTEQPTRLSKFLRESPPTTGRTIAFPGQNSLGCCSLRSACRLDRRVHRTARGLGIGKRLCYEVEQWARGKSVRSLRVRSQIVREDAHRFYIREGYRNVKTSVVFEKNLI
jgi:GNAT superfamily N-acetyltransferase